ncbi:ABC-2 type transport system permease protein [Humibacillus xanthopallidus]|uniref:Transport permease protein n=1 Tax=Humibacillus xanthopallidus TaxID=412689 RepID=A0A543PX54_9MICO|nr:ABC transporter permease [Humibacillus xanthopallidus]TQN48662.1 ABC-2 type transport system permease protein [Humibacillus xanthopallidus]
MILLPQARGIIARRQVLDTLVRRDLHVRYAGSPIGYLWTILDPLAMALIYFVVFTYIFEARRVGYQPYVLFIVIGVLAWQWFSQCATETSRALLAESRLVRSTNLPRELWVVRIVVAKGIEFLLSLPVMFGFAIFFIAVGETKIHYRILLMPVAIVLQFLLSVGVGLILAPVTVLFTDMPRIVRIALRMGFYATPIIYGVHAAPPVLQKILLLNPMAGILEMYRAGFFPHELNVPSIISSFVITFVTLIAGTIVFKRLEAPVLKEI